MLNSNIYKSKKFIFIVIVSIALLSSLIYINKDSLLSFIKMFKNGSELKEYLSSFGYLSALIFFLFQVFQVVIFFIPGEVIQAAGGYVFGAFLGTLISFLGITVGSFILFSVSQKLGRSFVTKYISPETHKKFDSILNNKKRNLIVFILYLLPGMPKDCLIMICALTNISAKEFMLYSMTARLPALFVSTYIGSNIADGKHVSAVIIIIVCIVLTLIAIFNKEKLLSLFTKKVKSNELN